MLILLFEVVLDSTVPCVSRAGRNLQMFDYCNAVIDVYR